MKEFELKIPGTDYSLSSNRMYYVREMHDPDAPDGYKRKGISKHPLRGIAQTVTVPYDRLTNTWNTGFIKESGCYRNIKADEKEDTVSTIEECLLPELESLVTGDLRSIRSENNELFDNFPLFRDEWGDGRNERYKIKGGNMYDTSKPLEFLTLWWALLGKTVHPPTVTNTADYRQTPFVLEDKERKSSMEEDKEFSKTKAQSKVLTTISTKDNKNDRRHLQNIFKYVGFNVDIENTTDKTIINTFSKWCEKDSYNNDNAVDFNKAVEKFKKEENKQELEVFVKLLDDIKKGKVEIDRKDIFVDGVNVGSNEKDAAKRIIAENELHKKFLEI